jgi:LacI family transcriptional regulator
MMAKQVDGVLLCSPGIKDGLITALAENQPLTLLNRRIRGIGATLMDSAGGMRQIVGHLADLGHERCAYLNGPRNSWSNRERRRGLRAAARQRNVEMVELGPFPPRYDGGVQAADLAVAADVTAIVAYNDVMALGVLARLRDLGIDVPSRLSVTGFDDLVFAAVCAPPLTTVAMPVQEAGRRAVDLLLGQLDHKDTATTQLDLPTHLIVRATTAAPPKR